ncbi:MAG: DNA-directed RNA polymerase subunit omega [Desemzia incerta]|uniref:DNA-directed RNA polymerase subunit omega n=1 Tax=Desemzia incerta TaxID=82801 RepID=UPI0024C22280|nr:DNA-directed RNA polymerase subunit omega [Desemzia incerta]WHZ31539.1 DNA-directed RNA polymerase subunit omega [Desemzia incerta]
MMLDPSIDALLEKIDSKYSLVIVSSKRAYELDDKAMPMLEDYKSYKNVGKALEEIASGDLVIDPTTVDPEV